MDRSRCVAPSLRVGAVGRSATRAVGQLHAASAPWPASPAGLRLTSAIGGGSRSGLLMNFHSRPGALGRGACGPARHSDHRDLRAHPHAFIRLAGRRLVINRGSIGMPYGRNGGACALLRGGSATLHRVPADADASCAEITAAGLLAGGGVDRAGAARRGEAGLAAGSRPTFPARPRRSGPRLIRQWGDRRSLPEEQLRRARGWPAAGGPVVTQEESDE
jgi:hypothetical protein